MPRFSACLFQGQTDSVQGFASEFHGDNWVVSEQGEFQAGDLVQLLSMHAWGCDSRPTNMLEGPRDKKTEHNEASDQQEQSSSMHSKTEASSSSVLDRLAALELQRKQERDRRKEGQQQQMNPLEDVNAFLAKFAAAQSEANKKLEALQTSHMTDNKAAQQVLDQLAADVVRHEQQLAESAYFLPSFDLKACTAQVQEFKCKLEAAKALLLPKKKFSFSSKVSRVKGADVPAIPSNNEPQPMYSAANSSIDGTDGQAGVHQSPATPTQQDLDLVGNGCGLSGLQGQVVLRTHSQLLGKDFVIMNCSGCHIYLLGHMGALRMMNLQNCVIVTGPVTGATFIDHVRDCVLVLASYQVRVHRAVNTDLYLRVRSRPIIEHSTGIRVAPYILQHDAVQGLLQQHLLHEETDKYRCVDDFDWIKAVQSPNWQVLPESERRPFITAADVESATQAK